MAYQHLNLAGEALALPATGKAVCVGQNYQAHMQEMGGQPAKQAVFFIKPSTSFCALQHPLEIPSDKGEVHFELELALLIGKPLTRAQDADLDGAIAGYAISLDLTLRDVQAELKQAGRPWERAKAFDKSCALGRFAELTGLSSLAQLDLALRQNGELRQQGNTAMMIRDIPTLLRQASECFTLLPGDVLLTGTPAGVGPLYPGDKLELSLGPLQVSTEVVNAC